MRKVMVCLFSFIVSLGSVYSVDEYRIGETIKVYDSYLEELQSKITYYPAPLSFLDTNNAIFIYFHEFITYVLIFAKGDKYDYRKRFIEVLDKCIEWTDVAKKNNVHKLSRLVVEDVSIPYMILGEGGSFPEVFIVDFIFSIQEFKGKEETLLIINYKTVDQYNNGERGRYIVFKQNDFNHLREIFSDNYLTQFDKKAEEQAKLEELFK